jgi:hypothetical protein
MKLFFFHIHYLIIHFQRHLLCSGCEWKVLQAVIFVYFDEFQVSLIAKWDARVLLWWQNIKHLGESLQNWLQAFSSNSFSQCLTTGVPRKFELLIADKISIFRCCNLLWNRYFFTLALNLLVWLPSGS